MPRKIHIKGCVGDWSNKEATKLKNDQVLVHIADLETTLPQGTRDVFDGSYSKDNQGHGRKRQ